MKPQNFKGKGDKGDLRLRPGIQLPSICCAYKMDWGNSLPSDTVTAW